MEHISRRVDARSVAARQRGGPPTEPAVAQPLRWMYWLVVVPFLTDIAETGRLPHSAREWITEAVAGALIAALVRHVVRQQRRLADLARSDSLTGLRNRRAFDETVPEECARSHRLGLPLTLVYIDLDNFKHVNDEHGHDGGDRVLRQLAVAIERSVRRHVDRAYRIGGDEFALLLPGVAHHQATAVIARVRQQVQQADALWSEGPLGLSAGAVELEHGESPQRLVARADAAMFACKRSGKTDVAAAARALG
ncbi:MAG TPA: GGDEF domain-containing protein [Burkholderiaceae bacterium]|nr:GGDEF domain-containing protein [Burkholderiaceae bacterium]